MRALRRPLFLASSSHDRWGFSSWNEKDLASVQKVQNRSISGPIKRTYVPQNFFKKTYICKHRGFPLEGLAELELSLGRFLACWRKREGTCSKFLHPHCPRVLTVLFLAVECAPHHSSCIHFRAKLSFVCPHRLPKFLGKKAKSNQAHSADRKKC